MISLKNVSKRYKDKVIFDKVNFKASSGEIVLLVGKSGEGKSTLLDMISGIKTIDSGVYFYNKCEIDSSNDDKMSKFRNSKIGYILQDFSLIDEYTVLNNITLPALYNSSIDIKYINKRATILIEKFDLLEVINKKVKKISGGQKQRVAIIRSLIMEPEIILADEPTTNLDAENFSFVIRIFKELKEDGKLIIIATHDDRFLSIADSIYQVDKGKLIKDSEYMKKYDKWMWQTNIKACRSIT